MFFDLPVFPNSSKEKFCATSPPTWSYNCIAWACGDNSKWYWPDSSEISYWPDEVPRQVTIEAFIKLFERLDYFLAQNGEMEIGFEKIAIFVDEDSKPTHAARQLDNGLWTSKLGPNHDISHSIFSMSNGVYGNVSVFMKRRR
jgi:hypothetical protein